VVSVGGIWEPDRRWPAIILAADEGGQRGEALSA